MKFLGASTGPTPPANRGRRRAVWVAVGAVVVAAVILLRTFVAAPLTVHGQSMEPTLGDGDVVLVLELLVGAPGVGRGDLAVFRDPDGTLVVKRVIGLPGDRAAIRDAVLEVDGAAVREDYVDYSRISGLYFGPVTVPAGAVFLLGDNRAASIDSRDYGPVGFDRIVGRVVVGLWPPGGVG
ncbi:N/A [soil metagenome]